MSKQKNKPQRTNELKSREKETGKKPETKTPKSRLKELDIFSTLSKTHKINKSD